MKNRFLLVFASLVAFAANAVAAPTSAETLKNLNTAFRGESNAHARYTAFAEKAASEGNAQVAKLFRAAATAEAIHRDTHKATLLKLGGTLEPLTLDVVTPGTTAQNLQATITGESYERDTMYPGFLKTAKAEGNRDAERSFHFAAAAEKEHAALYAEALAQLGPNAEVNYYVCPTCGETSVGRPANDKCSTCRKPTAKFIVIS